VVVPVVPVVLVPVVACPHAGNADTKRKVSPANIVRTYSTGFPLLVICRTNSFTIVYRCKQCNVLGDCLEATSPGVATKIRTFENTSPTPHLGNKMVLSLAACSSEPSQVSATRRRAQAASSPLPPQPGRRSRHPGLSRPVALPRRLRGSFWPF
jgi:hypothetical protein